MRSSCTIRAVCQLFLGDKNTSMGIFLNSKSLIPFPANVVLFRQELLELIGASVVALSSSFPNNNLKSQKKMIGLHGLKGN